MVDPNLVGKFDYLELKLNWSLKRNLSRDVRKLLIEDKLTRDQLEMYSGMLNGLQMEARKLDAR